MPRCRSFESLEGRSFDITGDYGLYCCGNRTGNITIQKGLLQFNLNLGGLYDTNITTSEGTELLEDIPLDFNHQNIHMEWTKATFYGKHWFLGEVIVELAPQGAISNFSPASEIQSTFFPATNENQFYFRIRLPRFGREYINSNPLVNRAIINSIPPVNAVYSLSEPVRFQNPINPGDWTNITKCYVMIPDQQWIQIDVVSIIHDQNHYHVIATLENQSPKDSVIAYWFTNTDESFVQYSPPFGTLFLGRKKKEIKFDMIFSSPPQDPVIQVGAAVITNPIVNDPRHHAGTKAIAIDLNTRMRYLQQG